MPYRRDRLGNSSIVSVKNPESTTYTVDSDGFLHSYDDKPAHVYSYKGELIFEAWYSHGYKHRLKHLSKIWYNNKIRTKSKKCYYLFGKKYKKFEEFVIESNRLEILSEI